MDFFILRAPAILLFLLSGFAQELSAETVHMNWDDFGKRLDTLADRADMDHFTDAERDELKARIRPEIYRAYTGFDIALTDEKPAPGPMSERKMGADAGSNWKRLGQAAPQIDYFNMNRNDSARIFTANFGIALSDPEDRSTLIDELGRSLGGWAAHELVHNLGLHHYNCFADHRITPANATEPADHHASRLMVSGPKKLSSYQQREGPACLTQMSGYQRQRALPASPAQATRPFRNDRPPNVGSDTESPPTTPPREVNRPSSWT